MLAGNAAALFGGAAGPNPFINDSFTKLLLHFDSGVPSTIVDSSPSQHGYATVAGSTIAMPNGSGVFGPSSLYNANAGYIYYQTGVGDFDFGSGDFTVDWWEYRADANDSRPIVVRNVDGTTYQPYMFGYSTGGNLLCYASSDNATWDILAGFSLGPFTAGVWSHRAIVRKGNTFYGFKDGVLQNTATSAIAFRAGVATAGPMIGYWVPGGTNYFYNGYVDEFRISKIARWTATFVKPTGPYLPNPPATSLAVSSPASVKTGTAFNVSVTALTANGYVAPDYPNTVHITSTDGAATLPANAALTNGVGTFSVKLNTAGSFTVTATDTVNGSVTGTSAAITATTGPASPQTLAFGSTTTWTVPADWTNNNSVEVIGGGGGGGVPNSGTAVGGGGGGGGYAKISNIALTPGAQISLVVGAGGGGAQSINTSGATGGGTYFRDTGTCYATGGGGGGPAGAIGAGGGVVAGAVGYSGGAGAHGVTAQYSGGGGGAAGMYGAGLPAGTTSPSIGGSGDAGNGGGAGGNGAEWGSWGSGGGASGVAAATSGNPGGYYGGAGSGARNSATKGGAGAQGIIIIKYQ